MQVDYQRLVAKAQAFFDSELFHRVQMEGLFADSKTFADALPMGSFEKVLSAYESQKHAAGFSLQAFVSANFQLPEAYDSKETELVSDIHDYIESLWSKLQRQPSKVCESSLLPLPHPYLVPGGRFREIYYWDSYFTALGLMASGRQSLVVDMIRNFIELQRHLGVIPNGNRSYYLTRSQPPILALMVDLLLSAPDTTDAQKQRFLSEFVPGLEAEYRFWMSGQDKLAGEHTQHRRVVKMPDGTIMNRYWDDSAMPRPESYREDIEAASALPPHQREAYYRNIRAACESGWDFSSRWLADKADLRSIRTTDILPVDLNCLLYLLESTLSRYWQWMGNTERRDLYVDASLARKKGILQYCWSDALNAFVDFDLATSEQSSSLSLAGVLPLFCKLVSDEQASMVSEGIKQHFLCEGGLLTTTTASSQQWDKPNGWAPLHWFAVRGLDHYQHDELADDIAQKWQNTVTSYYQSHQAMMEKYNLRQPNELACGGEYEVQHGFGWSNGVTVAFHQRGQKTQKRGD